jgi:hypothetical protein
MILHTFPQRSEAWFQIRLGKVTGTMLDEISGRNHMKWAYKIAKERITGQQIEKPDFKSEDMERGVEREPMAVAEYTSSTGSIISHAGFIQPDNMAEYFGMSPDGLIHDSFGNIIAVLEIKSPRPETHIGYIYENKIPDNYFTQVISPFICSENIQYVDFVSYCPEIASMPIWIKRISRNSVEKEVNILRGNLIHFNSQVNKIINAVVGF